MAILNKNAIGALMVTDQSLIAARHRPFPRSAEDRRGLRQAAVRSDRLRPSGCLIARW
jgi:hypothetical protein